MRKPKKHPDGMALSMHGGRCLITRVEPWAEESKYFDEELGAWVTRYKKAWATKNGFTELL